MAVWGICIPLNINAQSSSDSLANTYAIEGFYQLGSVLGTNAFVRGDNLENERINDYQALSVRFTFQTHGAKEWQRLYNCPSYGIGVYMAQFFDTDELGLPWAIYGFFNSPLAWGEKYKLSYDAGFGIAFNWENFDVNENRYNTAISAAQTVYIDLGLRFDYYLSSRWMLGLGCSFSHFSNGALKKPNKGINTLAPKLAVRYNLYDNTGVVEKYPKPAWNPQNDFYILAYTGIKNVLYKGDDVDSVTKYKGAYFNTGGISAVFERQVRHKSKVGIGATLGYYGAANASIRVENGNLDENEATLKDGFELSIFPSYELVIYQTSLLLQLGYYLYRDDYPDRTPSLYQRIGIKQHIFHNVFVGISLRAYDFYISDYIEWNIGYRFK